MNKILVIGQAPPAKQQQVPYDTTLFYDWLAEAGISKEDAGRSMVFISVAPTFTGRNKTNSGHKIPLKKVMDCHWPMVEELLQCADRVIVLGAVAKKLYQSKPRTWSCNMREAFILHPSRRNIYHYRLNKEKIIADLKAVIND